VGEPLVAGAGSPAPSPVQLAVASAKGSPGATTVALALGLMWPDEVVVGELDPAGGDLAGRLPMASPVSGVGPLAAAARHGVSWALLAEHSQALTSTCRVLVGRPDRVLSGGAVGLLADGVPRATRSAGVAGIWDLGRLEPSSPAWPTVGVCDLVVVVARPTAVDLAHAMPLVDELLSAGAAVGLVVASGRRGRRGFRDEEIAVALSRRVQVGMPTLARVPFDPLGVSMAERVLPRWAGRCALGGAVRQLVDAIGRVVSVEEGVGW
jgi:hypothetical protein